MMGPMILIAAAATPAAEQAIALPAAPVAARAAAPERGVISYPPAFFAESRPTSAYDMVLRVPGFTFDKGATVRGLTGSSGNVLIDGQPPVSKNDTLDEILKRVPAGTVERIELIRGGAPGIDMEGRTVLANVVRKQSGGFRGSVLLGNYFVYDGRMLPGLRAEAQWRWPGGRSAELAQIYGMGPNDEYGDGGRVRYNANGTRRLTSKVAADSAGTKIWTTGAYETPLMGGHARINGAFMLTPAVVEIYDNYTSASGVEYEKDDIKRLQAEAGGRFNRTLSSRVSLETVAFQQWNNNKTAVNFQAPSLVRDFLLDKKSTESVGRVHFRITALPTLTLETGVEGAFNKLDSKTRLSVNGRPVVVPAANVQVEETRGEVFLRGTWRVTPELSLDAGVRQEASRVTSAGDVVLEKSLHDFKPRAALTWAPDADNQFRLRVEREVGQLNFDDFVASPNVASTGTVVAGNPDLNPQRAWVYEAAYERRFWKAGAVVLTVRHYDISEVVDRAPIFALQPPPPGQPGPPALVAVADAPGNIGAATKDEVQASVTIPLERFHIRAAQLKAQVTKRWSKVDDPLLGGTREISLLRPIDWEVHFSQDLPRWKATWGADLAGGFRERAFRLAEIETKKFSPSLWLYGEYKPRPDFIIRLEAQGVTARNSRRVREVYIGPRNLGRLDYTDVRSLEWGGALYLRLRKTFG